jgi:hypothetical protein
MARKYEQRTYMEPVGRGFWGTIGNVLKWLILLGIALAILGALL